MYCADKERELQEIEKRKQLSEVTDSLCLSQIDLVTNRLCFLRALPPLLKYEITMITGEWWRRSYAMILQSSLKFHQNKTKIP
jgi:hypothetical protein